MKKIIILALLIILTSFKAMSQGYYFNIDKQQIFDRDKNSTLGKQNVDLTYIFNWGDMRIIERNNITSKFVIHDVSSIDVDSQNNKETWFVVTANKDSLLIVVDFTELESHNITLVYFNKDYLNKGSMWQHAAHFRTLTKEQVEEFINKLYR